MLITTIIISIIAFVYTIILVDNDMILFNFKGFLYKKIGKYPIIFKPIIDCEYCVAGQMAFWYYLYKVFFEELNYDWFNHLAFVSISIFNIAIIKRLKIYE